MTIITRDNKLLLYLTLNVILNEISFFFLNDELKTAFLKNGYSINTDPFYIFISLAVLATYFIILSKSILFVNLKDRSLSFGLLGGEKIEYVRIEKIGVNESIEIYLPERVKKIKVFSAEKNKDKYQKMVHTIQAKTKLNIRTDDMLEKLIKAENKKYAAKNGQAPGFGGLLKLLAVLLAIDVFLIFILSVKGLYDNTYLIEIIYNSVVFVFGILVMVLFFRKRNVALSLLKIYSVFSLVGPRIMYGSIKMIVENQIAYGNLSGMAAGLFFVFIIVRYLNISKRVKATFAG